MLLFSDINALSLHRIKIQLKREITSIYINHKVYTGFSVSIF